MIQPNKPKPNLTAKLSATTGVKPKPAMLKFGQTAWNIKDGTLYGKKLDDDDKEKIVAIAGKGFLEEFFDNIMFSANETHVIWKYIDEENHAWRELIDLQVFMVPEFSWFYILDQPTELNHGESIPSDVTFVWETNNCHNIIEDSIKISFDQTTILEGLPNENPNEYKADIGVEVVKSYGEHITFIISAHTISHGLITKEFTISWSLQNVYHGASITSNPLQDVTLLGASVGKISEFNVSFSALYYVIFACPENMHDNDHLSVRSKGCLKTNLVKLTSKTIHGQTYNVYISAPTLNAMDDATIKLLY